MEINLAEEVLYVNKLAKFQKGITLYSYLIGFSVN